MTLLGRLLIFVGLSSVSTGDGMDFASNGTVSVGLSVDLRSVMDAIPVEPRSLAERVRFHFSGTVHNLSKRACVLAVLLKFRFGEAPARDAILELFDVEPLAEMLLPGETLEFQWQAPDRLRPSTNKTISIMTIDLILGTPELNDMEQASRCTPRNRGNLSLKQSSDYLTCMRTFRGSHGYLHWSVLTFAGVDKGAQILDEVCYAWATDDRSGTLSRALGVAAERHESVLRSLRRRDDRR